MGIEKKEEKKEEQKDINELVLQRRKKLEQIKASGLNPYGERFEKKDSATGLLNKYHASTKEELEKRFKVMKGGALPSKGSMPFMVIFSDLPDSPHEFEVELVQ